MFHKQGNEVAYRYTVSRWRKGEEEGRGEKVVEGGGGVGVVR